MFEIRDLDNVILGKYFFSELSSLFSKLRLKIALKIMPKDTSHFFKLVLNKLADDIKKIDEKKRNSVVVYLNIEIEE